MKRRIDNKTTEFIIGILFVSLFFVTIGYSILTKELEITGRTYIPSDNVRKIIANGLNNGDLIQDTTATNPDTSLPYSSKYYFQGSNPQNYVIFNNACWRIINIAQNNTVKIVFEGKTTSMNDCVGVASSNDWLMNNNFEYGSNNNFYESTLKTNLELYNNGTADRIALSTSNIERIENATYHVGAVDPLSSIAVMVTNEKSNKGASSLPSQDSYNFTSKFGLVNASDVIKAGSSGNFLVKEEDYLTMNVSDSSTSHAICATTSGTVSACSVSDVQKIRPVVYLKSNTYYIGEGTETEPYRVLTNGEGTEIADVTGLILDYSEELDNSFYYVEGPVTYDGQTIDSTPMRIFSSRNVNRNFELSFEIDNIDDSRFNDIANRDSIVNTKKEINPYPGFVLRIASKKYEISFTNCNGTKKSIYIAKGSFTKFKFLRINNSYYYKLDDDEPILIMTADFSSCAFNDPMTFGGALYPEPNNSPIPDRYFAGTISNISAHFLDNDATIDDYSSTTIYQTVYNNPGQIVFDGTDATVLKPEITRNGVTKPIYLFSEELASKNFIIDFNVVSYTPAGKNQQDSLVNTKYENSDAGYPGFVMRLNGGSKFTFYGNTGNGNISTAIPEGPVHITIYRKNKVLYIKYGENIGNTVDFSNFTSYFESPLVFGSSVQADGTTYFRHIQATIENLSIKIEE